MKKKAILILGLMVVIVSSCKTIERITIDARTGETEFYQKNKGKGETIINHQYLSKSKNVEVVVNNVKPGEIISMEIAQSDIRIDGDEAKIPFTIDEADETIEEQEAIKDSISKEEERIEVFGFDEDTFKRDSLEMELLNLETSSALIRFQKKAAELYNDTLRDQLIVVINTGIKSFIERNNSVDHEKLFQLKNGVIDNIEKLELLIIEINSFVFDQHFNFHPSKEKIDLTMESKVTVNDKVTERDIYSSTFYQAGRFKMFGSVGAHVLFMDGKYAKQFSNKDSIIVERNGSNIQPSIGTYLNATWRFRDGLMGFGVGTGIPINVDGSTDLTPNLNLFYTCVFQTEYGRMGFNIGGGIRKVNGLKSGFYVGENIGSTSLEVPMSSFWKPAFMIGVNYNIGSNNE